MFQAYIIILIILFEFKNIRAVCRITLENYAIWNGMNGWNENMKSKLSLEYLGT
jgi:hypothetical protein